MIFSTSAFWPVVLKPGIGPADTCLSSACPKKECKKLAPTNISGGLEGVGMGANGQLDAVSQTISSNRMPIGIASNKPWGTAGTHDNLKLVLQSPHRSGNADKARRGVQTMLFIQRWCPPHELKELSRASMRRRPERRPHKKLLICARLQLTFFRPIRWSACKSLVTISRLLSMKLSNNAWEGQPSQPPI